MARPNTTSSLNTQVMRALRLFNEIIITGEVEAIYEGNGHVECADDAELRCFTITGSDEMGQLQAVFEGAGLVATYNNEEEGWDVFLPAGGLVALTEKLRTITDNDNMDVNELPPPTLS